MTDKTIMGSNTSVDDNALRAGMLGLTQLVDLTSYRNMEFYNAASFQDVDTLDVHREFVRKYPGGTFGSSEGSMGPYSTDEVFEKYVHLKAKTSAFKMTDEAKIRRDMGFQLQTYVERTSADFANQRDNDILNSIKTGYGVTKQASAKWDASGADVLGDFGNLLTELFSKDDVSVKEDEINQIQIYYPLKLYSQLREPVRLTTVSGQVASRIQMNTTDVEWSGNTYGVTWVGSQKLNYDGNAYAVIPTGDRTLNFYQYNGPEIQGMETHRNPFNRTDMQISTRYWGTMVVPESEDQLNSNYRIMRISTVCDANAQVA